MCGPVWSGRPVKRPERVRSREQEWQSSVERGVDCGRGCSSTAMNETHRHQIRHKQGIADVLRTQQVDEPIMRLWE